MSKCNDAVTSAEAAEMLGITEDEACALPISGLDGPGGDIWYQQSDVRRLKARGWKPSVEAEDEYAASDAEDWDEFEYDYLLRNRRNAEAMPRRVEGQADEHLTEPYWHGFGDDEPGQAANVDDVNEARVIGDGEYDEDDAGLGWPNVGSGDP